jgi:hypothetical protein
VTPAEVDSQLLHAVDYIDDDLWSSPSTNSASNHPQASPRSASTSERSPTHCLTHASRVSSFSSAAIATATASPCSPATPAGAYRSQPTRPLLTNPTASPACSSRPAHLQMVSWSPLLALPAYSPTCFLPPSRWHGFAPVTHRASPLATSADGAPLASPPGRRIKVPAGPGDHWSAGGSSLQPALALPGRLELAQW